MAGTEHDLFVTLGASNHSDENRAENDYYATDPIAMELLLEKEHFNKHVWECACGEGTLDINLYAQLATAENPCMPMIIEHLTTDEAYVASVQYVRDRLSNQ